MKNKNKINTAFSLVEISIVIVVIGILISGISSGIDLYREYKVTAARNYTINSKVSRIPDIGFWLDTTRLKSLETASGSLDPKNGDKIKNWNSINYLDTQAQLIANQNTDSLQPIYIENGLGGLPTLWFEEHPTNGGKIISIPYTQMFGERYTEIYVALKSNGIINNLDPIVGSSILYNSGWAATIEGTNLLYDIKIHKHLNALDYWFPTVTNYDSNVRDLSLFRIIISDSDISCTSMKDNKNKFYPGATRNLVSSQGPFNIGYTQTYQNSHFFNGEISEIIFFKRNLNNAERVKVNEYFKEKYKLKF